MSTTSLRRPGLLALLAALLIALTTLAAGASLLAAGQAQTELAYQGKAPWQASPSAHA